MGTSESLCSASHKSYGKLFSPLQNLSAFYYLHSNNYIRIKMLNLMRLMSISFRYEMQDLHVAETLPQMVELSEAYMQIYELQEE